MKNLLSSTHFLKTEYNLAVYLASYYRWSASKSNNAAGSRSPIDGNTYTNITGRIHNKAYKAGQIAMSKSYLNMAKELRKNILK